MVVVVVLSGIPYYATTTEIAETLDHIFDTDEIGTFRVRSMPNNGIRRYALDFKNGFDAMSAQYLLHGKVFTLPNGSRHVLKAKVVTDKDLMPSRSPSPELSWEVKSSSLVRNDWKATSLETISDEEINRVKNAKLDAQYQLLMKEKLVIKTERKLLQAKKKLEKEYKMARANIGSYDDKRSRSRSKSPGRKYPKRNTKSLSTKRKRSRSKGIRRTRSRESRRSRSKNTKETVSETPAILPSCSDEFLDTFLLGDPKRKVSRNRSTSSSSGSSSRTSPKRKTVTQRESRRSKSKDTKKNSRNSTTRKRKISSSSPSSSSSSSDSSSSNSPGRKRVSHRSSSSVNLPRRSPERRPVTYRESRRSKSKDTKKNLRNSTIRKRKISSSSPSSSSSSSDSSSSNSPGRKRVSHRSSSSVNLPRRSPERRPVTYRESRRSKSKDTKKNLRNSTIRKRKISSSSPSSSSSSSDSSSSNSPGRKRVSHRSSSSVNLPRRSPERRPVTYRESRLSKSKDTKKNLRNSTIRKRKISSSSPSSSSSSSDSSSRNTPGRKRVSHRSSSSVNLPRRSPERRPVTYRESRRSKSKDTKKNLRNSTIRKRKISSSSPSSSSSSSDSSSRNTPGRKRVSHRSSSSVNLPRRSPERRPVTYRSSKYAPSHGTSPSNVIRELEADNMRLQTRRDTNARVLTAIRVIVTEMHLVLNQLNASAEQNISEADKEFIVKEFNCCVRSRFRNLRAENLTVIELVKQYHGAYSESNDKEMIQRLLQESIEMSMATVTVDSNCTEATVALGNNLDSDNTIWFDVDELLESAKMDTLNSEESSQETKSSTTPKESLNGEKPDSMLLVAKKELNPEKTDKDCVEVKSVKVIQDTVEQQAVLSEHIEPPNINYRNEEHVKGKPTIIKNNNHQTKNNIRSQVVCRFPKFVISVKKILEQMHPYISELEGYKNEDIFLRLLTRNIRKRIRELLTGITDYINWRGVLHLYRECYPSESDDELVLSLLAAINEGKYDNMDESDEEIQKTAQTKRFGKGEQIIANEIIEITEETISFKKQKEDSAIKKENEQVSEEDGIKDNIDVKLVAETEDKRSNEKENQTREDAPMLILEEELVHNTPIRGSTQCAVTSVNNDSEMETICISDSEDDIVAVLNANVLDNLTENQTREDAPMLILEEELVPQTKRFGKGEQIIANEIIEITEETISFKKQKEDSAIKKENEQVSEEDYNTNFTSILSIMPKDNIDVKLVAETEDKRSNEKVGIQQVSEERGITSITVGQLVAETEERLSQQTVGVERTSKKDGMTSNILGDLLPEVGDRRSQETISVQVKVNMAEEVEESIEAIEQYIFATNK